MDAWVMARYDFPCRCGGRFDLVTLRCKSCDLHAEDDASDIAAMQKLHRPLLEHIATVERDILDSMAIPSVVLMGTPSTSGMYFNGSPTPDWRREYMGQWNVSSKALDAEKQRQRRDDHVDALKYAIGIDPAAARTRERLTTTLDALAPRVAEFWSRPRAVENRKACPVCSHEVYTYSNDDGILRYEVHNIHGVHGFAGQQCAGGCARLDDTRYEAMRKALVTPPKPPTLREWLGDRVGEIGRWADVLREQPVPAGWIASWEWDAPARVWRCHGYMPSYGAKSFTMYPDDAVSALLGDDCRAHDAYRMALANRHPDVKPEPKPSAFPWDPYPEVI